MRPLRIGIDCRSILRPDAGERAGVGHYVHHLVEALLAENAARHKDTRHAYVLFFDSHDAAQAKRELHVGREDVTVRVLPFRRLAAAPFVYAHMIVAAVFGRERLDVLHGPANVVPLFYRRPWVVTVHDLAIYDHPEWFPAGTLGTQRFSTDVLVPHSLEHATRVIAVSEATAADARRLFPKLDPRRIDVVHEGAAPPPDVPANDAVFGRSGVRRGRYLLSVCTIEPRKNLATAARAFAAAVRDGALGDDSQYVIAGARGWKDGRILAEIKEADASIGGHDRIRWIGYLPNDDKHALLAGAAALAFPSLAEGFGLPLLEAMAAGVPVVASDIPASREVAGDTVAFALPTDVPAHKAAIAEAFARGPAVEARVAAARQRAAGFTWARAAAETVAVYERAAAARALAHGHDAA